MTRRACARPADGRARAARQHRAGRRALRKGRVDPALFFCVRAPARRRGGDADRAVRPARLGRRRLCSDSSVFFVFNFVPGGGAA
ncbi:hypothetical protein WS86_03800 [Burkholderia savannae]|nr:hypothetical protein WS86_03800 [Burkholderia savannae]